MRNPGKLVCLAPALLFILAGCGSSSDGGGNLNPPGPPNPPPVNTVQTQQVFANVGLSQPTALKQAPGDATRWFAIGQAGVVTVFDNDTVNATGATFLDISARVNSGFNESGLLGIAFHPDFTNNGEVFLSYTGGGALTSVVSRFRSFDGNQTLDPASEEILLTMPQPAGNHNGGDMHFDDDGFLYAGFGDGGGAAARSNSQDVTNLYGSIIRIDVNTAMGYTIPPDNPFVVNAASPCVQGVGGAECPEIYAWGFRNPWRFSFDSSTDELWVGDVGQSSFEEVNRVQPGENYGWPTREGAHCFDPPSGCATAGLTDPIAEYGRSEGQSVTGGFVYRGTAIADLVGQYVFGDFVSGRIFAVPADSPTGTTVAATEIAATGHSISAFAEGIDGELYVVDYGGSIHQIVP